MRERRKEVKGRTKGNMITEEREMDEEKENEEVIMEMGRRKG